eukprot:2999915-Pleurochrysis_carterae.AAC.1
MYASYFVLFLQVRNAMRAYAARYSHETLVMLFPETAFIHSFVTQPSEQVCSPRSREPGPLFLSASLCSLPFLASTPAFPLIQLSFSKMQALAARRTAIALRLAPPPDAAPPFPI